MTTIALAILIVLGEWTGLARGLLGSPVYAAVLDGALVVLVAVAFVRAWRQHRMPAPHPLDVLVLAFAGLAFVQMFNPNVPSLVVGLEGFRKTAFTMLAYAVIRLAGARDTRRFYAVVALGSIPAFLWAIRQAFVPLSIDLAVITTAGASPISFHAGQTMRAFSPTAGPFHLGILSGTVLLVAVAFGQRSTRWFSLALLAAVALGLSITRANIGATAAAVVVMAVVQATTRDRLRLLAAGMPAVALAFVMALAVTSLPEVPVTPGAPPAAGGGGGSGAGGAGPIIDAPSLEEDRSLQFRLIFWREQLSAIADRPLVGYGTSAAADGFDRDYAGTNSRNFNPHSLFTKPALELGVVGFVLFIGILITALISILRTNGANRLLATISIGLFVLVTVSGLTGPMLDAYPFNVLFWATLGWVVVWRQNGGVEEMRGPVAIRNGASL